MIDSPNTRPVLPGEDVKAVSLREFEQRNSELRDQFTRALAHERELREVITQKLDKALELNATEIFRRLEELNHAHRIAMENWARSLPRELFDQWQREYEKWREEVGTTLTMIAPHAEQLSSMGSRLTTLEAQVTALTPIGPHVMSIDARVSATERLVSKATGALILLGFMGLAGVLSLILGLARLTGAVQ